MNENDNFIKCPHCGENVDIGEGIAKKHIDEFRNSEAKKLKESLENEFREKQDAEFKELENKQKEEIKAKVDLKDERIISLESTLKEQNIKTKEQVDAIRKTEEKRSQIRNDDLQLKNKELEIKLEQLRLSSEEMSKKANQGSMQLQGEAQELIIEEFLIEKYPNDKIEEVKKGKKGADCIQIVCSNQGQEIGKIVWESKRTNSFQSSWISKLIKDTQIVDGDIGVVVTQAMPKDMPETGEASEIDKTSDGFYICQYNDFKSFANIMRSLLIKQKKYENSSLMEASSEAEKIYKYLSSRDFEISHKSTIQNIKKMTENLKRDQKESEARHKRMEKDILNIAGSYFNTIQGMESHSEIELEKIEMTKILDS